MNSKDFSEHELKWFEKNKKTTSSIAKSIEDHSNVNPLDNGNPDMEPYYRAVLAAKITIDVAERNLIKGPYDEEHYNFIAIHINSESSSALIIKKFWSLFSYHCACYKEELGRVPKERIYMEALVELLRIFNELAEYDDSNNMGVYDFNTNSLLALKGEGVLARFG